MVHLLSSRVPAAASQWWLILKKSEWSVYKLPTNGHLGCQTSCGFLTQCNLVSAQSRSNSCLDHWCHVRAKVLSEEGLGGRAICVMFHGSLAKAPPTSACNTGFKTASWHPTVLNALLDKVSNAWHVSDEGQPQYPAACFKIAPGMAALPAVNCLAVACLPGSFSTL